ncbi:MAG TPA: DUF559 domain-containing protein [Sphingobium sp.]|nr:DUF559 domain-containing protein [Sphingobium sp.]
MSLYPETVERAVAAAVDHYSRALTAALPIYDRQTESPIELAMMVSLIALSAGEPDVQIMPQVQIGQYRVDFLLQMGANALVVECDGHDYHERTKQQAAADRSRDRAMLEAGYHVMRFTGSEIWKDALACARQALNYLEDAHYRAAWSKGDSEA